MLIGKRTTLRGKQPLRVMVGATLELRKMSQILRVGACSNEGVMAAASLDAES